MPGIYGDEPKHRWCYYFQKAELARQRGDWERAAQLGEEAYASGDHPNDPTENFVFIEAYAHIGAWGNAKQLSAGAMRVSPSYMRPLLCPLWARIDAETPEHPDKGETISQVSAELSCEIVR